MTNFAKDERVNLRLLVTGYFARTSQRASLTEHRINFSGLSSALQLQFQSQFPLFSQDRGEGLWQFSPTEGENSPLALLRRRWSLAAGEDGHPIIENYVLVSHAARHPRRRCHATCTGNIITIDPTPGFS